jgi:hypothetical protein
MRRFMRRILIGLSSDKVTARDFLVPDTQYGPQVC